MGLHVHVDRAPQVHLPVLNQNRVLVLRDAIHRAVEDPVEDDARRLAAKTRIVIAGELRRRLFTKWRELGAAIEARAGLGTRAATTTAAPLARFQLLELTERHQGRRL